MNISIVGSLGSTHDKTCQIIRQFLDLGWTVLSPEIEKKWDDGGLTLLPKRSTLKDLRSIFLRSDVIYIICDTTTPDEETLCEMSLATQIQKPLFASDVPPLREIADCVTQICEPKDVMLLYARLIVS